MYEFQSLPIGPSPIGVAKRIADHMNSIPGGFPKITFDPNEHVECAINCITIALDMMTTREETIRQCIDALPKTGFSPDMHVVDRCREALEALLPPDPITMMAMKLYKAAHPDAPPVTGKVGEAWMRLARYVIAEGVIK